MGRLAAKIGNQELRVKSNYRSILSRLPSHLVIYIAGLIHLVRIDGL